MLRVSQMLRGRPGTKPGTTKSSTPKPHCFMTLAAPTYKRTVLNNVTNLIVGRPMLGSSEPPTGSWGAHASGFLSLNKLRTAHWVRGSVCCPHGGQLYRLKPCPKHASFSLIGSYGFNPHKFTWNFKTHNNDFNFALPLGIMRSMGSLFLL